MASAMVIARKRASAFLIPGSHAGRGSWHAPAPTRYRFSIQGADSRVPLPPPIPTGLDDARRGGGRWAAWAWAGASFSSLPGGDKDGGPRMWRALQDIKAFAQRQEVVAENLVSRVELVMSEQTKLTQLVLELKACSMKRRAYSLMYFSLFVGLLGWSYSRGTAKGTSLLDEFVTEHLSNIITDPKVQESIRISAVTYSQSTVRALNPYYYVKGLIVGGEHAENATRAQLASRATCLAVIVFTLVPDDDIGITEGVLLGELHRVGLTEDNLTKKTLDLLVKSGYLKKATTKGPEGEMTTIVAVDRAVLMKEFVHGILQAKVKKALGWRWWNSFVGFH